MKNILIVEDDILQNNFIAKVLMDFDPHFVIHTTFNAEEATIIYTSHDIDLFILDVNLSPSGSSENGIDIGKNLRQDNKYKNTPIIYITGIPEMIDSAINVVHCYNYIKKPYRAEDIINALTDINDSQNIKAASIAVKDFYGVTNKLSFESILYIQSDKHTQTFYSTSGIINTRELNLTQILYKLPDNFVQVHKSYIINIKCITSYDRTCGIISIDKCSIPVGRSYKANFELTFNK